MAEVTIKKGDEVYCVHRKAMDGGSIPGDPIKGKIITITKRLNRQIGVQLDEPVLGGHDCEGRGESGKCLWVRPWQILTPAEWASKKAELEAAAARIAETNTEVEELVLRNVG